MFAMGPAPSHSNGVRTDGLERSISSWWLGARHIFVYTCSSHSQEPLPDVLEYKVLPRSTRWFSRTWSQMLLGQDRLKPQVWCVVGNCFRCGWQHVALWWLPMWKHAVSFEIQTSSNASRFIAVFVALAHLTCSSTRRSLHWKILPRLYPCLFDSFDTAPNHHSYSNIWVGWLGRVCDLKRCVGLPECPVCPPNLF